MNLSEHTVLSIKIVFFIIISGYLFYKYYKLIKPSQEFSFPPWSAKCPDRWEVHGKGCKNKIF